jgi:hypothetical protein
MMRRILVHNLFPGERKQWIATSNIDAIDMPPAETDPEKIKEIISARPNLLPFGHVRRSFTFRWVSCPIAERDERDMGARLVEKGNYSPMTEQEIQSLSKYIQRSSTRMSTRQAMSLRNALLQQKAVKRHYILVKDSKILARKYNRGESVLSLSRQFDYPPVNVFRAVLTGLGYSKKRIKTCLQNPREKLESREYHEFEAAEKADIVSNMDQEFGHQRGEVFEDIVGNFLKENGITFVRQDVLAAEQLEKFKKAIATPDFLFIDNVEINGQRVAWIDVKSFYGANTKLRLKKTRNQAARYIDYWGTGAIFFLEGFGASFQINGCTMLSARDFMATKSFAPLIKLKERHSSVIK